MISPVPGWGAPGICGELAPPVPYGKAGRCTAEMRLPAVGGTPYRGTSPKKQKGQADRLSFLIIMPWAGSPGRPGRPRAVPLSLPERRHQPSASPRAAPGLRRAATAHPPFATPHGRRYAGQCRWARLRPGSPSPAGSLRPRGRRAVPRAPPAVPAPGGGGAALPPGRAPPTPAAVRSAGAFSGASPAGVPGPRRHRRRRTPISRISPRSCRRLPASAISSAPTRWLSITP